MDLTRRRKERASPLSRKLPFVILAVHLQAIMMMVMMRRDIMIIAMMVVMMMLMVKMSMPVIYLEAISRGQPLLLAVMEDTLTKKMLRYFCLDNEQ